MMEKTGGILLCAGFGSRLAPLTEAVPKPAIPFCGVPMAHYARRSLERAGVCAMGMNVHHLPERMVAAMDGGRWAGGTREMLVSRETEILGTGGGAAVLARMMPECARFVVYHGDVLCAADVARALESHVAGGARVTMVVLPRPAEVRENVRRSLGMIGVRDGEVVRIRDWWKAGDETGEFEPRCFAGIHILERSVLDGLCGNVCLVTEVYRRMLETGERIHAYEPGEGVFFADVGTPATYLEAQRRCLEEHENRVPGRLELFSGGRRVGETSYAFGKVRLGEDVVLGPNVCVNPGAGVDDAVRLHDAMIFGEGMIREGGTVVYGG